MTKVQVGFARDVAPGTMRRFQYGESRILVANIGGNFSGIGERCTHRGCSLSMGRLEGEVVTCPCHGSGFNVKTGAVVRGPAEQPEQLYGVTVEGDGIWVDL